MEKQEILLSIREFLASKGFQDTCHKLDEETILFFDIEYTLDLLQKGKFLKACKYLNPFIGKLIPDPAATEINDSHKITIKILHDLHLQRYLEAIYENKRFEAFSILQNDLKPILSGPAFIEQFQQKVDLLSHKELPQVVIDNFVSSKDKVNWGKYCDEYFIPHFSNLFKNHPELSKKLLANYRPPEALGFIDAVAQPLQSQPSPPKVERRIIEIDSPKLNHSLSVLKKLPPKINSKICRFGIAPIKQYFVTLIDTGEIYIYNLANFESKTYNFKNSLPSSATPSHYLEISNNDFWICSGSGEVLYLYNILDFCQYPTDLLDVSCALLDSSDQNRIYFSSNNSLKIYNAFARKVIFESNVFTTNIISITMENDYLACISREGEVVVKKKKEPLPDVVKFKAELWEQLAEPFGWSCVRLKFTTCKNQPALIVFQPNNILLYNFVQNTRIYSIVSFALTKWTHFTISSDNLQLVCLTNTNYLVIYSLANGEYQGNFLLPVTNTNSYPTQIVAHPKKSNCYFVGNTLGEIYVLEINI